MSINNNIEAAKATQPYQFYINDSQRNRLEYKFKKNKINTRKYNWVTFVPHALLIQFLRPANIYFLISAILNCIPQISPLNPVTAILPLIFVLAVSLIREAVEDCKRGSLDRQQNNELTYAYRNKKWVETQSGDLDIGELVFVGKDQTFPADIILIDSKLNDGLCFIETATLDGEKTLKQKEAPKELTGKFNANQEDPLDGFDISGTVLTDPPNQDLYLLSKIMKVKYNNGEEMVIPLSAKQLLLKGAKLKNTPWVVGIVVYVGHDCKIMKNAKDPVTKYSSLERVMNFGLVAIFIIQAILCIIAAILRGTYYHHNNLDDYDRSPSGFGFTKYSYGVESFLNYFTYTLLLNTLIPISLIVTLEIVKMIQGCFMNADSYAYSHVRKRWLTTNSVSLNEECGLVKYIFSDKTGTLTCNKMNFKYCVIGDVCYQFLRGTDDEKTKEDIEFREQENIIPFNNYDMYRASQGSNNALTGSSYNGFIIKSEQDPNTTLNLENAKDLIENYWYALSLCHSCTIHVNEDDGKEEYICVSPDSIELVKTAKLQGFHLIENDTASIKKIKLGEDESQTAEIEFLYLIEFSSDRKRETVIVKDKGVIKLYCKGADSIIKARVSPDTPQQVLKQGEYYVDKFSKQGYRTLFISMKILSQAEFDSFMNEVKVASTSLDNKDELLTIAYEKVEKNLYIIGATIVEDKLQDNVPETIRDLHLANIKIWMLTGDKMDTAENIAKSCNLINEEMTVFRLCGNANSGFDDAITEITDFSLKFREFKGRYNSMSEPGKFAILIDEKMLARILPESEDSKKEELGLTNKISNSIRNTLNKLSNHQESNHTNLDIDGDDEKLFMMIAKDAASVICCRVSPSQKSKVVLMMKRFYPSAVTLAIGDGGNDVPMIMEAHIGVGIYGEEGMRAVQSSDYAIGEFQYLRRLLLFHGRTNYIRNAECVTYFFYKNFSFTLCQFLYGFYCNFTGQTIVDDLFISSYNLLFTSLPLGARALLDHDIKPSDGSIIDRMLPFLYSENRERPIFTIPKFFLHLLKGTIHCLINFFFIVYLYKNDSVNDDGQMGGLWFLSVNIFTSVLMVVTIDLLIFTKYHTWINFVVMLVTTFIAYIIFVICAHNFLLFNSVGTMAVVFKSPRFWVCLVFVLGTCGLIDYFILGADFIFFPSLTKVLQRLYSERGDLNDEQQLPKCICDRINKYKTFEQQKFNKDNDISKIPQNSIVNDINDGVPQNMYNNNIVNNTNNTIDTNMNNNINNNIMKNNMTNYKNNNVNIYPLDSDYLPISEINKRLNSKTKPNINININNKMNENINFNNVINKNDNNTIDNTLADQPFFPEITNSNMNINNEYNNDLFNQKNEEDDLDIFPNYPRPSLGNENDFEN